MSKLCEVSREQIKTAQVQLARAKSAWGESSPKLLPAIKGLSDLYFALGEYYSAEQLCWRALAIAQKNYGDIHPAVGEALQDLGESQEAQGLCEEAERFYLWSLSVQQKCGTIDLKPILSRLVLLYRCNEEKFKAKIMEYKLVESLSVPNPVKIRQRPLKLVKSA